MPRPINLFIRPPFSSTSATPPGPWTRLLSYGAALPGEMRSLPGELAECVLLQTTDPATPILAAATGYLSTRYPNDRVGDTSGPLIPLDLAAPVPRVINVYLNPRPFVDLYPGFTARATQLAPGPPLADPGIDSFAVAPGILHGFLYINLDTQSVFDALSTALDTTTTPSAATVQEREQRWRHFLAGNLDIPVDLGQAIGHAGDPLILPAPLAARHIGFTILTRSGTLDPAHLYDWMRDFAEDEPDIDEFLQLVPPTWPLLDPALSAAGGIADTADLVYPYAALTTFADTHALTPAQWREIANNQKELYRRRLLKRFGLVDANDPSPPFTYNMWDWKNLFQLEAVTEFFLNFPEPWDVLPTPVDPADPAYRTVDLLPLQGTAATVTGTTVTLDGGPDLSRIWPGKDPTPRDTLILANAGGTLQERTFRITEVDLGAGTLTVDRPPNLSPLPSSPWRVMHRPDLVVIDPLGPRLRGDEAYLDPTRPSAGLLNPDLTLDVAPGDLTKVNRFGFETVFLYADTATGLLRPRTYLVMKADNAAGTVTLNGTPDIRSTRNVSLANGAVMASSWYLPAGLGGELPLMDYNLGTDAVHGWDHYDGVMFVVVDGEVRERFRWTSATSHNSGDPEALSSVRGNARYYLSSIRSTGNGGAYRNFCFEVVDEGSLQRTPTAWTFAYDGVRENRHYFERRVTEDSVAPPHLPVNNGPGKTAVRIHYGNRDFSTGGTGSEGCIVSPLFFDMRAVLIERFQEEYAAEHGADAFDADLDPIYEARTLPRNKAIYPGIDGSHWNDKLVGTLWLVRPDERPIG